MVWGFELYGVLMIVAAERTFTHAGAQRTGKHRVSAVRPFALTLRSWLCRME